MHIAQIWGYTNSLSVCLYTAKSVQCALLLNVQGQLSVYGELKTFALLPRHPLHSQKSLFPPERERPLEVSLQDRERRTTRRRNGIRACHSGSKPRGIRVGSGNYPLTLNKCPNTIRCTLDTLCIMLYQTGLHTVFFYKRQSGLVTSCVSKKSPKFD